MSSTAWNWQGGKHGLASDYCRAGTFKVIYRTTIMFVAYRKVEAELVRLQISGSVLQNSGHAKSTDIRSSAK